MWPFQAIFRGYAPKLYGFIWYSPSILGTVGKTMS
jgi:hypothetical protein